MSIEVNEAPLGVELTAPDITPYRDGNRGIPYVLTFDSGRTGPHLWLNALTHGKEVCGAWALDFLLQNQVRPSRGKLTLSFANVAAFENRSAADPLGTRAVDEDLNRVWDRLDSDETSIELDRARQLRLVADEADILIDLHAMTNPTEPLTIVGLLQDTVKLAQGIDLAKRIGLPSLLVADVGHTAGLRLRDYGAFGDPTKPNVALVVECGGWWQRRSAPIAIDIVLRTLRALGMLDRADLQAPTHDYVPGAFRLVEATETVTIRTDAFRWLHPYEGDEIIPAKGTVIAYDGDQPVQTPFDDCFLMFPLRKPRVGVSAVRLGRVRAA